MTEEEKDRFVAKIAANHDDYDACWDWTASKWHFGHGYFSFRGRGLRAHRVAMQQVLGVELPESVCVCHLCDRPQCVNPNHLWLGSIQDNVADRVRKGRSSASRPKLDIPDIKKIRQELLAGRPKRAIARDFGIAHSTLHAIEKREIWKHVP